MVRSLRSCQKFKNRDFFDRKLLKTEDRLFAETYFLTAPYARGSVVYAEIQATFRKGESAELFRTYNRGRCLSAP